VKPGRDASCGTESRFEDAGPARGVRSGVMKSWGIRLALLSSLVVSCGSDSGSGPVDRAANPCATRGATYYQAAQEISGNCGPIPSQIVNVNPDGTITSDTKVTCAKVTQSGCTARDTDCKWASQGVDFTMTFSTTFADDGSSAMGLMTVSGNGNGNGQSCTSTYSVTMTRQ
jgi:hypothetical protein